MIATQIQQIYYGRNFKTQQEVNIREDLAPEFDIFLKSCVDQGLIEDKQSWDWDATNQVETIYFFSKDMIKAKNFQQSLLESEVYQKVYQAIKTEGCHISVGMVNFIETDDTQYVAVRRANNYSVV